ncbi:MAG: DNA mismatch repair protein MutS [Pyrinomonadaceae bacterium]
MQKPTPMLRQYLDLKKQYPGTLLLFRLGDFYELFNEDALIGARELEITLTARQKNTPNEIPMCGVPHHAASGYISKLIRKGYRVAICEQTEDASKTKSLVKREVVRVITPGTAIDDQLLEKKEPVYLASVCGTGDSFGVAYLELSTGDFLTTEISGNDSWSKVCDDIRSFAPRELLFPASIKILVENSFNKSRARLNDFADDSLFATEDTSRLSSITLTELSDSKYDSRVSRDLLIDQFGVKDLSAYGLEEKSESIRSAGSCLGYALETQRATARHISEIKFLESADSMILDAVTLKNLEIIESNGFERSNKRSLLGVIDSTVTGMGGRLLRSWLLRPSVKRSEIQTRRASVAEFMDTIFRDKIRFLLKEVSDLERLVGRLNLGTASPRDLLALNSTLDKTPGINSTLADAESLLLQVLRENIFELPSLRELISSSIADEPPVNFTEGGVIREGFNTELDDLRTVSRNAKQIIAGFENSERERTGISSLKVKFNNVFGYFIEISKANSARAPEDYERRQTLTNSERYTTPQLKEWEDKVLGAEERIKELEAELFREVRSSATKETQQLQSTARALAALDALSGLAEVAAHRNYVAPELHDGDAISIKEGRHPIVEAFTEEPFVPNDLTMNNSTDRLLIITGANMGGKSTVLRQIALIQILAQIGSFVPASAARLPIVDRIWTRVGASDDLASGRSTFMVEMTETATILHNSTPNSLILLDEIGRGTSTFDGLAIAWAVAEYLHNSPEHSAKTLFATHYHELTELAEKLPGAKNMQITAKEEAGEIVFLHKLEKGKASKSYGIAVAKLAGLPPQTILRAKQVLEKLEKYELAVFSDNSAVQTEKGLEAAVGNAVKTKVSSQVSLFAVANENVIDELRDLKPDELSPEESKQILKKLKEEII